MNDEILEQHLLVAEAFLNQELSEDEIYSACYQGVLSEELVLECIDYIQEQDMLEENAFGRAWHKYRAHKNRIKQEKSLDDFRATRNSKHLLRSTKYGNKAIAHTDKLLDYYYGKKKKLDQKEGRKLSKWLNNRAIDKHESLKNIAKGRMTFNTAL